MRQSQNYNVENRYLESRTPLGTNDDGLLVFSVHCTTDTLTTLYLPGNKQWIYKSKWKAIKAIANNLGRLGARRGVCGPPHIGLFDQSTPLWNRMRCEYMISFTFYSLIIRFVDAFMWLYGLKSINKYGAIHASDFFGNLRNQIALWLRLLNFPTTSRSIQGSNTDSM